MGLQQHLQQRLQPLHHFLQRLVQRVKPFLPACDHPAALQPTPYGLNRYVLLAVYVLNALLTSCVYFGWGPLSSMLFRAGIYLWLCTTEEQSEAVLTEQPVCLAQDIGVQRLFTVCYAAHFILSALAGALVDLAGPKITALLGQTLSICGWLFLGASSQSFRAVIPAFVMIGASSDLCFFPVLTVSNLFPGSVGFAVTCLSAASSLSFAVPLVLRAVQTAGLGFSGVCWGYAVFGPFFCLLLVVFFVPLDGFIQVDMFVLVARPEAVSFSPVANREQGEVVPASPPSSRNSSSNNSRSSSSSSSRNSSRRGIRYPSNNTLSSVTDDEFFKPFWQEAFSCLYFCVCLYFGICSVAINYYQQAANYFLLDEALEVLNIAIPLSTLPCLVLGRLADYVPVVYIMVLLNTAGALSYGLAINKGLAGDMASVIFFSVYISFFSSQVYIYLKEIFTSTNYGRLVGVASMFGGGLSLLGSALYDTFTVGISSSSSIQEKPMWGVFGIVCAAYLLLLPLLLATRNSQRNKEVGDRYGGGGPARLNINSSSNNNNSNTSNKNNSKGSSSNNHNDNNNNNSGNNNNDNNNNSSSNNNNSSSSSSNANNNDGGTNNNNGGNNNSSNSNGGEDSSNSYSNTNNNNDDTRSNNNTYGEKDSSRAQNNSNDNNSSGNSSSNSSHHSSNPSPHIMNNNSLYPQQQIQIP
ncbi:transporter, major facilitator family domain containing protein, putative [Eimeria brunetti]|uniref:Transporter, major facilitator family domain containing protein, putative n=1 Tax=Eimeria brunetti TaxID=51314 RepID=U6LIR5_9EIME|nr:transporter, major facilitator family domain containing protein, putative [Eimeria brunetti]